MSDQFRFPARDEADAKAWFYLDHRRDIETWAALSTDAGAILEKYLLALDEPLKAFAEEQGAEADTADVEGDVFRILALRRPSWIHDVSVVIQWEREALLSPGDNEWPFVAVRVSGDKSDKKRWTEIAQAMAPVRKSLAGNLSKPWAFWRFEQAPAEASAVDPEALAAGLFKSFCQLWAEAAPILDLVNSAEDSSGREPAAGNAGNRGDGAGGGEVVQVGDGFREGQAAQ